MRFLSQPALIILISVVSAVSAHAQIDPSSALLLNSGRSGGNRDSGLDSGRYDVRPRGESVRREYPTVRTPPRKSNVMTEVPERSTEVSRDQSEVTPSTPASNTAPAVGNKKSGAPPVAPTPAPKAAVESKESTNEPPAQAAREESVDVRRLPLLEVSVAPGYTYVNSDSNFAYRKYHTASPSIGVDARVWLSPSFALQTSFLSTLSGNVNDSFDGSRSVAATHQWITAGIRSRHFFGPSALSPILTFGLDYYEYQFRVPSDSQIRGKLKTTGAILSIETELPATAYRSWTLGFTLAPKLQHSEAATEIDFKSGGGVDANAVGVSLGGKIRFDASNSVFWKISHTVEKDLFSGEASIPDPLTNVTPSGVGVTNSTTSLQLGYTWGN